MYYNVRDKFMTQDGFVVAILKPVESDKPGHNWEPNSDVEITVIGASNEKAA